MWSEVGQPGKKSVSGLEHRERVGLVLVHPLPSVRKLLVAARGTAPLFK
jgi:hypothetical protein